MVGNPGHAKLRQIIENEAYRRIMAGEAPEMLNDFAQQLSEWFGRTHPTELPVVRKTVEEMIRDTWDRRHQLIRGG